MKKKILFFISLIFTIFIFGTLLYLLYPVNHKWKKPFPEYDMSGNRIYPTTFEFNDLTRFKGKEVHYFLKSIKRLEYVNESSLVSEGEPGILYGWQFNYIDSILIEVYVQDFKFLKPKRNSFEEEQYLSWSVDDFLKEEISRIIIYKQVYSSYDVIVEVK